MVITQEQQDFLNGLKLKQENAAKRLGELTGGAAEHKYQEATGLLWSYASSLGIVSTRSRNGSFYWYSYEIG